MEKVTSAKIPDNDKTQLKEYAEDHDVSQSKAIAELIDIGLRQTGYKRYHQGELAANMSSYVFISAMGLMVGFFTTQTRVMMYLTALVLFTAVLMGLYADEVRNERLPRSKGEFKRLIRRVV